MFVDASTNEKMKEKTFLPSRIVWFQMKEMEKKTCRVISFDEASKNMKRLETSYMMWKKFDDGSQLGSASVLCLFLRIASDKEN